MRIPSLARRQDVLIDHPLLMGLAWGLATCALIFLVDFATGRSDLVTPHGRAGLLVRLVTFVCAGPVWGYATRWAILRSRDRDR